MTNRECRKFLGIDSPDIVYRLLKDMDLEVEGAKRNRTYVMKMGMSFRENK